MLENLRRPYHALQGRINHEVEYVYSLEAVRKRGLHRLNMRKRGLLMSHDTQKEMGSL